MKDPRPQPIHRKDYRPPDYWIDAVDLRFELGDVTRVTARLELRRNPESGRGPKPLVLQGERLTLRHVELDGKALASGDYFVDERTLRIPSVPEQFELRTVVEIEPGHNTELSGLYRSGDTYCTQCEAEGFRRITYFLDRPDVMARYSTEIVAERERYPVLLSNGNRVGTGELPGGLHWARWEDPFPKPSYLFALVAADLRCHAGTFVTRSGRSVRLEIWVEPHNIDACAHALASLQRAMQWDEEVFGLEYDLDVYMIVAVSDFNMAAMENKGLNLFNAKFVLARPETATDDDYEDIEGVIAHEYFHNWTGNRVTCRDWFQLTLKEGLTVFRDEQFTADMTSPAVKRIRDVRVLRTAQFAEDGSPTAHPIRPDAYIEMNNFYTVTVYNKGAEVVRMLHTLLGQDGFRRGMDLYFARHDGQAVTCDDFLAAMADANGVELEQFALWYSQAGTPTVEVEVEYEAATRSYVLHLRQHAPANADAKKYRPMHIPIAVGLLDAEGRELAPRPERDDVRTNGNTAVLELRSSQASFRFLDVDTEPVPSLLRNFSAPVHLRYPRPLSELAFLMGHDADPFARWDAAQSLTQALLLDACREASAGHELVLDDRFVEAFGRIIDDPRLDGALKALTLELPDERLLGQKQEIVDVDGLHAARGFAFGVLARAHREAFLRAYEEALEPYERTPEAVASRRLRNVALAYLVEAEPGSAIELALRQLEQADNMTDVQAALAILVDHEGEAREHALASFYARFRHDPIVLDKWFSVQATSRLPHTTDRVLALSRHPDFTLTQPNRARSLVGAFALRNQTRFHTADGRGYRFVADAILEVDVANPQLAARFVAAFTQWRRFDTTRRELMHAELERILATPHLSRDVYELTSKCLGDA